MTTRFPRWDITSLALLAGCLSGCATLSLPMPWEHGRALKATAQNPAVQVICLWEQAEGRDPDGVPCRGFAGQILFLANRHATPVEVDGDVRIYLFDNQGTMEEQSKPLRQYDFSSEAWQMHLTKSAVGPSYSVFVPYTRRGQHNAQCSLRLRMKPKQGPVIFSELSTLPLRGAGLVPETTVISSPASPEERVQKEVEQALSQVLQKTSTIPLARTSTGSLAVTAPAEARQPAAATADERLSRMEKLLENVLAEKQHSSRGTGASGQIEQVNHETLAPEEPAAPPRRFRLDRATEH